MSDNGEEEEDEPVVELGDGDDVEGAPVARVASRLFFPIEKSEVLRREGETTVRTPDGAQSVADVLEQSDEVYFETNADLVNAVESVVGMGPVPTVGGSGSDAGGDSESDATGDSEPESEPEPDTDEKQDTDEESDTAESAESPEGAGESGDAEVAEGAETAESPATEPEEDEGNREAEADDGEFEFDDE